MARIPVNSTTVSTYLAGVLTAENYQLFYGLHLLPDAEFGSIMDALLNGDCQPEELVRLGSFSQAEADTFIQSVLGNWTGVGVMTPTVGTDGYYYLTQTLGLETVLQGVAAPPVTVAGPDPARFLGVRLYAGAPGDSYVSADAINQIFLNSVMPAALPPNPFNAVFPGGPGDVLTYILNGVTDPGAISIVQAWYAGIFQPLTGASSSTLCSTLFQINDDLSIPFAANPGLAQWVLAEPEVPPMAKLLLLREAAVRSANGDYATTDIEAGLAGLQALTPGTVGTSRDMAFAYFWTQCMTAAVANLLAASPGDPTLTAYQVAIQSFSIAYTAISNYRLLLRGFLGAAYTGIQQAIQGNYPAG